MSKLELRPTHDPATHEVWFDGVFFATVTPGEHPLSLRINAHLTGFNDIVRWGDEKIEVQFRRQG